MLFSLPKIRSGSHMDITVLPMLAHPVSSVERGGGGCGWMGASAPRIAVPAACGLGQHTVDCRRVERM